MSADPHASHDSHGHHEAAPLPHAHMRDYAIGFILSVILTGIPFWLVMARPLETGLTIAIVTLCAVVQVVVHMVYFLHMTPKAEDGWSMTSLLFTLIVVVIMLSGSLWVMYHLNTNMMPTPHDMRQMP
jgi:cytochrome o ubiquinol oxidase operon protein cyoD